MRAALYKCPNHLECTLGYHGDDIEVTEDMARICPECGAALVPISRPRSSVPPLIINTLIVACFGLALYLAWPHAVKLWQRFTAPPAETRK